MVIWKGANQYGGGRNLGGENFSLPPRPVLVETAGVQRMSNKRVRTTMHSHRKFRGAGATLNSK